MTIIVLRRHLRNSLNKCFFRHVKTKATISLKRRKWNVGGKRNLSKKMKYYFYSPELKFVTISPRNIYDRNKTIMFSLIRIEMA